jgi:hypothetical protein
MSRWIAAIAAGLALAACDVAPPETEPLGPSGDRADFATYVQPVLRAGCASLDCHGDDGRPLRLYARNGLRRDVTMRGLDADDAELTANMLAIRGLEPDASAIEDNLLLLKPLSVDAGGVHHVGGDLFLDQNDRGYRCLHAWLRAGVSDEAGRAICTQARP